MANQPKVSLENNFTGGLKTEFTGLNFPENACTDTENCIFSMMGDVTRRPGFDYEDNYELTTINRSGKAISSYKWNNAGGDGLTQILVEQVGGSLYFYKLSSATIAAPLSTTALVSTVPLASYLPTGSVADPTIVECQYSDGNGYLFVYHPYLDPFYCTYSADAVTSFAITVQVRDFDGIPDNLAVDFRPTTLTDEHNYNLQNQGWTAAALWSATATGNDFPFNEGGGSGVRVNLGSKTFTVPAGLSATASQAIVVNWSGYYRAFNTDIGSYQTDVYQGSAYGVITSYAGTTMVLNLLSSNYVTNPFSNYDSYITPWSVSIGPSNINNTIDAWHTAISNYPSNADVWWAFKSSTGAFDPTGTIDNVFLAAAPAPKGHFVIDAFDQQKDNISGLSSITPITTTIRPKTGTWFQGRVWYAGVDASQAATGDQAFYSWTESIYFSQIVTGASQFGMCYQTNDPTGESLFNLLPTDGGVIKIQGCGSVYKLFPVQNGMLVFAANGIWFITGSQGIGFTANDYTITKISAVQSMSCTSYVNVQGFPLFWNEEGIYAIEPAQQGLGMTVNPITVGTILSFYAAIPVQSKKFVRGDYNPLTYEIKWIYRSTNESSVTTRYEFDSVLNFNVYTKAFYPYTLTGTPKIHGINYIAGPGGSTSPDPVFKYVTSVLNVATYSFTFSEENDFDYLDWYSYDSTGVNFNSYFVTGYKLHGQALRKWQPEYVYMYSRNDEPTAYKIQGIWNYASSGNSGKYSSVQVITNDEDYFGMVVRRHRIRGSGVALQLKVSSVDNEPFDIMGWAIWSNVNASV